MGTTENEPRKVLAEIRVVEFSIAAVIPLAGKLLALMGAEVIKVESRHKLDVQRLVGRPPGTDPDTSKQSYHFKDLHLNKKSITLNLSRPEGVALAKRLVAMSDVVVENFAAGVIDRMGLGYEVLRQTKPNIIMISASGSGHSGPEAGMLAVAPIFAAISGLGETTGYRDGPPFQGRGSSDMINSFTVCFAIMAALHYRHRTGKGQYIDYSSREGLIDLMGDSIMDYTMNGRVQTRQGNRDDFMAPHNCYRCQGEDKWVSIAVGNDAEWQALCQAMSNPPWTREARFSDGFQRWRHQEELDRHINDWTRHYTPYQVMEMLQRVGVAAVPSFTAEDLYTDPHLAQRGLTEIVDDPEGAQVVLACPWKFSATPPQVVSPSPSLGQHNDYVFGELLGLSQEEIARLEKAKVLW